VFSLGVNELAIICGLCAVLILLPLAIMLVSNRRRK
jgi:hypothetical protein